MLHRQSAWPQIALSVFALAFGIAVLAHGIPALRHDWWWPTDRSGVSDFLMRSTSGWVPLGIGAPNSHPDAYFVALLFAPVMYGVSAPAALLVFMLCIAALIVFGAYRVAARTYAPRLIGVAASSLALFNPWTYTQIVAGHSFMLIAYGAVFWLIDALLTDDGSLVALAASLSLTTVQFQFFLPSLLLVIIATRGRGRGLAAVAISILVASPSIAGLVLNARAVQATPYTLTWEANQSVALQHGLFLGGYFAQYFPDGVVVPAALGFVLMLAVFGAIAWPHQRNARLLALVAVAGGAVAAAGLSGPLALLWKRSGTLPIFGLYRELYDIIGLVAVAYVCLIATMPKARWVQACAATCCGVVVLMWMFFPPADHWVNAGTLPRAHLQPVAQSRFALLPAFQPLSYSGRGSGIDPDAYDRDGMTPLNSYISLFPEDVALTNFQQRGDSRILRALSVSQIVSRPLYASVGNAFGQSPAAPDARRISRFADFIPEVSTTALPVVSQLLPQPDGNTVFVGDLTPDLVRMLNLPVTCATRVMIPQAAASAQASMHWIDARLAFGAHPRLAQALGGAFTTSRAAIMSFSTSSDGQALAFVAGGLKDGAQLIARGEGIGYQWLALRKGRHAFTCTGMCAVAALRQGPPCKAAQRPPLTSQYRAARFAELFPWLVVAYPAATTSGELRYNTRYYQGWIALDAGRVLPHFRLDALVNAWIVPPHADKVMLIFFPAAIQALLEILGCMAWLGLGAAALASARKYRRGTVTVRPSTEALKAD